MSVSHASLADIRAAAQGEDAGEPPTEAMVAALGALCPPEQADELIRARYVVRRRRFSPRALRVLQSSAAAPGSAVGEPEEGEELELATLERRSKYAFLQTAPQGHTAVLDDATIPQCVWPVSEQLVRMLADRGPKGELQGRRVLELGSGVGICGLAAARFARSVVMTDVDPVSLALTRCNAEAFAPSTSSSSPSPSPSSSADGADGAGGAEVVVGRLDWTESEEEQRAALAAMGAPGEYDVVIASDVLYGGMAVPLMTTVQRLLASDGQLWLAHQRRWSSVMRLDSCEDEELVDSPFRKFQRWLAGPDAHMHISWEQPVGDEHLLLVLVRN